jgi:hypothetical protein
LKKGKEEQALKEEIAIIKQAKEEKEKSVVKSKTKSKKEY